MSEDLPALLARLEAAEGPDRDLDAALHVGLCKPQQYPDDLRYYRLPSPNMDHMEMCAPGTYWLKKRSGQSLQAAPHYTASLDAAIALCERAMPGWGWSVTRKGGCSWACVNEPYATVEIVRGEHTQPALAICIAIVKALIAQQAKDAP